jgi:hypothetical protein
MPRDRFGQVVLPRVIERPPRPGDVHPLDRRTLLKLLPTLPLRFLHGLRGIELRARDSKEVGHPFGTYQPYFKLIRLYSTPYPDWPTTLDALNPNSIVGRSGGCLIERDGQRFLRWPSRMALARYFFARVFAHELGHHHVYQYKHKRSPPGSSRGHEDRADALMYEVQGWARFNSVFGDP